MVQKSEAARAWEALAANQPLFSPKVGKYISWTLRASSAFSLLTWIILLALSLDLDGFFTHGSLAIPALWGFITALWARAFVKDALHPSASGVCASGYSAIWRILQAILCFICVVCFAVMAEEGAVWMCIIGWFVNILGIMLLYSPQKQEKNKRRRSAGMELLLLNSTEEGIVSPPAPEQRERKFYLWLQVIGSFLAVLSMVDVLTRCTLASSYPPRGRVVLGGNQAQMSIECQGQGTPTILFEPEVGTHSRVDFRKQFEALQKDTRVCWYDKEGYGRSQNSNRPKDHHEGVAAVHIALSTLLTNAGENGPFLFVGHGMGGAVSRFFSLMEPNKVAGLMLLDASHEEMSTPMDWVWPLVLHSVFAPLGVDIWLAQSAASGVGYSDFDGEDLLNYANDRFWKAVASENYWWEESAELLIASKQQILGNSSDALFGHIPISVLTAGQTCASYNPISIPATEMVGAVTSSDNTLVYTNQTDLLCKNESGTLFDGFTGWLDLQRQLACESSDFFWEVYPSNGHFLTLQQPDLVTKRLKDLLARSRAYLSSRT